MSLQRLVEDYLLEQGWTARPPIDPDAELRRIAYWRDPEHPTASSVALVAAFQRVVRRERRRVALSAGSGGRVTHGRHCPCSACAKENWSREGIAPCGMHGPSCPPIYAPIAAGSGGRETT